MSITRVAIVFMIFYVVAVSSELWWSTFTEGNYARICGEDAANYDPNKLCQKLGKEKGYKGAKKASGSCQNIYVKLKNDNPNEQAGGFPSLAEEYNVILCNIGKLVRCLSASSKADYYEYFDYLVGSTVTRCQHSGRVKLI